MMFEKLKIAKSFSVQEFLIARRILPLTFYNMLCLFERGKAVVVERSLRGATGQSMKTRRQANDEEI